MATVKSAAWGDKRKGDIKKTSLQVDQGLIDRLPRRIKISDAVNAGLAIVVQTMESSGAHSLDDVCLIKPRSDKPETDLDRLVLARELVNNVLTSLARRSVEHESALHPNSQSDTAVPDTKPEQHRRGTAKAQAR